MDNAEMISLRQTLIEVFRSLNDDWKKHLVEQAKVMARKQREQESNANPKT